MDRQRPTEPDTRAQRDPNPQGTKGADPFEKSSREEAVTSPSSPAGVETTKVSPTATRRTFTSALLLTRQIEVEMPGFPPQDGSTDCAICIEREGTVMAQDGRLICEICDGDRARGFVA